MAEYDREELLRKISYGYWAAFAGLALQLVGFLWDGLLHHLDPTLSAREDVFSITNPSHLLIVLGLGLAVAGVAWGMFLVSARGSGFQLFWGPTVAIANLLMLSVSTSLMAIATKGLSGGHDHQSGHSSIAVDDPVLVRLKEVLMADGTKAAMYRLKGLAAEDEDLKKRTHRYVHELGKFSYFFHYRDADVAFRLCGKGFDSGCYHGVVQGYFEDHPDFEAAEVTPFCEGGVIDADATGLLKFQCAHGLGHGLEAFFDHDLREALRYCDFLRTDRDRHSCYGGVFMENIHSSQGSHGGQQGDDAGRDTSLIEMEDFHYPCNSVEDRYKSECYVYRPLAITSENGRHPDEAFEECERAPRPYVAACYRGVGAAISALTIWEPDASRELCMLGSDPYRARCFEGVVQNLIGVLQTSDGAFDFCADAPGAFKRSCFETIGESVGRMHADIASRYEECEKAGERRWVTICQQNADLSGWYEDEIFSKKDQ